MTARCGTKEAKELAAKTFAARKDRPRKYNVQVVNEDTGPLLSCGPLTPTKRSLTRAGV